MNLSPFLVLILFNCVNPTHASACYNGNNNKFIRINRTTTDPYQRIHYICLETATDPILSPVGCVDYNGTVVEPNGLFRPLEFGEQVARCKLDHKLGVLSRPIVGCEDVNGNAWFTGSSRTVGSFKIRCSSGSELNEPPSFLFKCRSISKLPKPKTRHRSSNFVTAGGLLINCEKTKPRAIECRYKDKIIKLGDNILVPEPNGFLNMECTTRELQNSRTGEIRFSGGLVPKHCVANVKFQAERYGACSCLFNVPFSCVLTSFPFKSTRKLIPFNGCHNNPLPMMCQFTSVWNDSLKIVHMAFWQDTNEIRRKYGWPKFTECKEVDFFLVSKSAKCDCNKTIFSTVPPDDDGVIVGKTRGYVELFIIVFIAGSACICGLFSFGASGRGTTVVDRNRKLLKTNSGRKYYQAPMHYVKLM